VTDTEPVGIDEPTRRRAGSAQVDKADLPLLAFGVLCVSTSGPLIALTAAPALAIAFWRNGLAAAVLLPVALVRHRRDLLRTPRRRLALALLAGTLLAAHFGTYVPSLHHTTVASAAALVCSQSVWAALFARILGERLPTIAWVGIALALGGVLSVTGVDFALSADAVFGDVLALLGGMFGGAYMVTGGQVRRHLSTTLYTALCYTWCALLLLAVCLVGDQRLAGYALRDWALIAALTVLAQLLGHSVFNHVLRATSPTVVSLATLFSVPLAAVLAALLVDQTPPLAAVPALGLLVAGIGLVIWSRDRRPGRLGTLTR
jgi:drug/metabolite transporter (DMT)-like permease